MKNYIESLESQINNLNNNNDNENLNNEYDDLSIKLSYDKSFKDLTLVKSFLITDDEINNSVKKSDSLEKKKPKEKSKRNKYRKLSLSTENKTKNEFFNAPIDNKLFSVRDKNKQHKFFISKGDNDNNNYQIFNENNNIMKKKIEFQGDKINNNQNNCEKEISNKRINKFQIEMSLDSEEEEDIKQIDEIHDENSIIKQKDNQSMISEDSIGYLMDSLKEIDNKKEKNSSSKVIDSYKKFMNNVKDSISNNNNNKINNNNINFGRFYNLGLNSLSNSNINNVKNDQNKYIYGGQYDSYKQKYNMK